MKHVAVFVTLSLVLVSFLLFLTPAPIAHAAGVVSVCDESHLVAALSGGGSVTFACSGTITLTSTITIASNTTLDGAGQTVTISGDGAMRVFWVNAGATFNLQNLTVANGNSMLYDGSNGGGIHNEGEVNINSVTFYRNLAYLGGALFIVEEGTATVTNSTFTQNDSLAGGGAIFNANTMDITNSTFSDNHFAIVAFKQDLITVTKTRLWNNIIANSSVNNCAYYGVVTGSNNLADDDSCGSGFTYSSSILLGTLGDYGGSTETVSLLPGSAAIDAGDDATCAASPVNYLDQRGVARSHGTHCDIGAFESRGFTLTKTSGDNQGTPVNTAFALPLAVRLNETGGSGLAGSTITFSTPGSGASATLSSATATTDSGGNASVTATANGTAGSYNVTAGTPGAASVDFHLTNLATTNATMTTLTSAPNPSDYGQLLAITATVTSTVGTPTGSITFYDNGSSIGSGTLNASGQATMTTTSLIAGTHPITATYGGDATHSGSTSLALGQTVNPRTVTATIGASSKTYDGLKTATVVTRTLAGVIGTDNVTVTVTAAAFVDQRVGIGKGVTATGLTLSGADAGNYQLAATTATTTANITPAPLTVTADNQSRAPGAPDPTFTFHYSGFVNGETAAVLTTAPTCRVNGPHGTPGSYPITCSGGVDENYSFSYVDGTLSVGRSDTTSTLTSAPNPSLTGQNVTFTVTVSSSVMPVPTGAVTVTLGGSFWFSGTLTNGHYVGTTNALSAGTYVLVATYGGDASCDGSTSLPYTHTVKANTTTTLTSAPNASLLGQTVTLTATIAPAPTGGTVQFYADGVMLGAPVAVSSGRASTSTAALGVGAHPITATYSGDPNYAASTSNQVNQQVNNPSPTISTISPTSALVNAPDFTLTVTGTNFVPTSAVRWSNASVGTTLTTTYVSARLLTAAVPGSLLSAAGPISVTVLNSTPGGGRSNSGSFTINPMPSKTDPVLTLVCNPCIIGREARLTATVTNTVGGRAPRQARAPRDAAPTGNITFQDNGANIPDCVDVPVHSAGQAVCSKVLSGGHHIFIAQYSGDGNFNQSSGTLSADVLYYLLLPYIQRR